MSKTKAGAMLVLFTFLVYTLVFPVLSAQRAWALPVKPGSRGAEVKEAQTRLQALGFLKGKVDGVFGPKTLAAVRNFQRKWKLKVDGIVGRWTMGALRKSTSWIGTASRGNTGPPRGQAKPVNNPPSKPAVPVAGGSTKPGTKPPATTQPGGKPPATTQPGTKPPATGQPGNQAPAANQPDSKPTGNSGSGTQSPAAGQPDSKPPGTGQPDSKPAGDTQSDTQSPATNQPGAQPSGNQPDTNSGSQGGTSTPDSPGQSNGGSASGPATGSGNQDGSAGKPEGGSNTPANSGGNQGSGAPNDNGSGQSSPGNQNNPPVSRGDNGSPAGIPAVASGKMILGFTAEDYIGDRASYNSVVNFGQNVDAIATFTYFVDGNGNLNSQTPVPRDTIKMAKSKGMRALALIHNFQNGFDKEIARSLMTSPTARQNLINQLLVVLPREGYDGINVDIEGIYPADLAAYIDLLKDLKAALKPKGYWLTVSIPAKTFHNPKDGWSGGFDYKAIGELADHVLIMTYDQNWMGGTPGPIATLPWVEQVVKYAVSQMPAEKILMGLATYGYDWGAPRNRALSYPNAVALARQYGATVNWHQEYQVPYFKYRDAQGNQHEVWFEDQNSTRAKLQLVKKYGLAGVGIWRLGFEDSLYWDVMKEYRAN